MPTINAAGTIPWRCTDGTLEVAMVHRPRYDDWSWSKGKLEPGEPWAVAAYRETFEETGLQVRLGMPLPPTTYRVLDKDGLPATKLVRYWAAEVTGGDGALEHEIDAVAWLDPTAAHARLDYSHDREQLRAIQRAQQRGAVRTWPLVIVRHAFAVPRSAWHGSDDRDRPLSPVGERQVQVVTDLLRAYGVTDVVSSPSTRCVQTIGGYAATQGVSLRLRRCISEEGFAKKGPGRASALMTQLLEAAQPVALCSHGPVLPTLLTALLTLLASDEDVAEGTEATLSETADLGLDKGDVLVAHLVGAGESARVVAVERIPTQSESPATDI